VATTVCTAHTERRKYYTRMSCRSIYKPVYKHLPIYPNNTLMHPPLSFYEYMQSHYFQSYRVELTVKLFGVVKYVTCCCLS